MCEEIRSISSKIAMMVNIASTPDKVWHEYSRPIFNMTMGT